MIKYSLISFLLLTVTIDCVSQQESVKNEKTNLEIFNSLINSGLDKFFYNVDLNRDYQFIFVVNQTPLKNKSQVNYLKNTIKKIAFENKLYFNFSEDTNVTSDSSYNLFVINPLKMQTNYDGFVKNNFLGNKTINRNIYLKLSVNIRTNYNKLAVYDSIQENYNDEINYDNYENVESPEYEFTQAVPPETSPVESILFPALLVAASATATLLFFLIRSK